MVALILFPVLASLSAGFGLRTVKFMLASIEGISGVICMFVFAILFFGIMTNAGILKQFIAWLRERDCSSVLPQWMHAKFGAGSKISRSPWKGHQKLFRVEGAAASDARLSLS